MGRRFDVCFKMSFGSQWTGNFEARIYGGTHIRTIDGREMFMGA